MLRSGQRIVCHPRAATQTVVEPAIKRARVGVAGQCVEAMPHALGLSFDLERVIMSQPGTYAARNHGGEGSARRRCDNPATQSVPRNDAARARLSNVHIHAIHQDVMGSRSGVPSRDHNISRHLTFNIQVELLNLTLFEVKILPLKRTSESA